MHVLGDEVGVRCAHDALYEGRAHPLFLFQLRLLLLELVTHLDQLVLKGDEVARRCAFFSAALRT